MLEMFDGFQALPLIEIKVWSIKDGNDKITSGL